MINCYGQSLLGDDSCNVFDFAAFCNSCPHCIVPERFGDAEHCLATINFIFHIEKENPFDPSSALDKVSDLVSDEESARFCVYFIGDGEFVKIGKATRPLKTRLSDLQTANARKLFPLFEIKAETQCKAMQLERFFHVHFNKFRKEGEWFDIYKHLNIDEWRYAFDPFCEYR